MNILVLDTASPLEIIAVCTGTASFEMCSRIDVSHSVSLLDNIDRCLKKAEVTLHEIDVICVGIGPGSFTGIRIAVSTARMLSQVLGVPLLGIKTQLLYAVSMPAAAGDNMLIAFDAKKGRVFGALYQKGIEPLHPIEEIPPGDYAIECLLDKINPAGTVYLTGDGVERYRQTVTEFAPKGIILQDYIPNSADICGLVRERYLKNPDDYADYNRIVPYYARKSDAEAAKELKGE